MQIPGSYSHLLGRPALVLVLLASASIISAEIHIRYNQAGYLPDRPKSIVLISDEDLAGREWSVSSDSEGVLGGSVPASLAGTGSHTSHPYNHVVDISDLVGEGEFVFEISGEQAIVRVSDHPYSVLITDALRHLRTARSGSDQALNHGASHMGDSVAVVHVPDGQPSDGQWVEADPHSTVDMTGGWYDAGDYIKFTLTTANTVYYLLEAWEANGKAFTTVLSTSGLPDVLDEALHGLVYLMKTHPSTDLFVIQVGDGNDHKQGPRLPETDGLDGSRPALCAISPVHMGLAAAALARGTRVFGHYGRAGLSDSLLTAAVSIFSRARQPDALAVAAFERDQTNDFYRDNTLNDNMALGALELYRTTGDQTYLDIAVSLAPGAGSWIGWGTYNWSVNAGLEALSQASGNAAQADIDDFIGKMDEIWGIPQEYTWGSLIGWNAAGAASGTWNRLHPDPQARDLHLKMVDLMFGRNNWGVSFLASTRLENSVTNIYSQIYKLTGAFPMGAVSLGPADRQNHTDMEQYFGQPPSGDLDAFQTTDAVFYDWEGDFVTQETVTMSQSYAIWILALASDTSIQAPADSSVPQDSSGTLTTDSTWSLPLSSASWYVYSDADAGGNSSSEWTNQSIHEVLLTPTAGAANVYAGFGFSFPAASRDLSAFDGMKVYGFFTAGLAFRVNLAMSAVNDYDYHGGTVLGGGETTADLLFEDLAQQGFGVQRDLDVSSVKQLNINYLNTSQSATVRIDSVVFYRVAESPTGVTVPAGRTAGPSWSKHNGCLVWHKDVPAVVQIRDALGRMLWESRVKRREPVRLPKMRGPLFLVTPQGDLLGHLVAY